MRVLLLFVLAWSGTSLACPDGQYEMCVVPRPWGGCAQKVCVPNGGTIVDGASDGLKDLNMGVIQLGNGAVNTTVQAGKSLGNVADRIDWEKVKKVDWGTAVWIASAIWNGAACIASDGASPGVGVEGSTMACSENACACAAISIAMAVKNRSDMSEEERGKVTQVVNDPQFEKIMKRSATVSAANKQLSIMGIKRTARPTPEPDVTEPGCPGCIVP